jgi:transcriptional regulator with XRE-family HTH domain
MNIQNLDRRIYALIKKIRIDKKLTQEELAIKSNKDRTYISGIERFERNISLKTLIELLAALEIDIETFTKELLKSEV